MINFKSSRFILTLVFVVGFSFIFSAPLAAKSPNSPDSFIYDNGDAFQKNFPNKALKGFWLKLTEQQQKKLRREIRKLKEQSATPQQIKEMIHEYLKKWGIRSNFKKKVKKGFWKKLTKEQKRELVQGIKERKEKGKSPKEIKAYIRIMLIEWGIWQKK